MGERWRRLGIAAALGAACGAFALAPTACAQPTLRGDLTAHDPSRILQAGDAYYLFATGRGITTKASPDLHTWRDGPSVFAAPPDWVRAIVPRFRGSYWAPDVVKLGDRYLLFYSASTFGSQRSAIGLATNAALDPADPNFKWEDRGIVIESNRGSPYNAIDPAALVDDAGRLWLAFGSFWGGIYEIELDPATGKPLDPAKPATHLARNPDSDEIEAAYLHHRDGKYYLFVSWGKCCRGVESTYNIRVGRGDAAAGPFVDRAGKPLADGGGTLLLATEGPRIGPGHPSIFTENGVDFLCYHYYDGDRRGRPTLGLRELNWTPDGWPEFKPQP
jgi:arabinan endo-1,5-alpha-L-arabinosidase